MPTRRALSRGEGGSQSEPDGARTKWAESFPSAFSSQQYLTVRHFLLSPLSTSHRLLRTMSQTVTWGREATRCGGPNL